jgi:transcriptional regulator with XRE-family HTH domain
MPVVIPQTMPIPVRNALRKLGGDIRDARLRRRIPMAIMSQRALVTRATLHKVEQGEPTVSMGTYATVLFILGMTERLAELADARFDRLGAALEKERLPQRIRTVSPGSRSRGSKRDSK